jgi:translation elongation factor EF-G
VVGVKVVVDSIKTGDGAELDQLGAIRNACTSCVFELYTRTQPRLMEPVFAFEAIVPEKDVGDILGDLSGRRRADILSVDAAGRERMLIKAHVPAIELLAYSKLLRSLTAGHGAFSAKFARYVAVEIT